MTMKGSASRQSTTVSVDLVEYWTSLWIASRTRSMKLSGDFTLMLVENNLQDNDALVAQLKAMTHEDDGLLESIKESKYLFS